MKVQALTATVAILFAVCEVCASQINFDTFPDGSPVPNDALINTQYAALGVVFSSDSPLGSPRAGFLVGEASSQPNFLYGDIVQPCDCAMYKIFMSFSEPLPNRIDMTLISVGRGVAIVTAFAADQTVLDITSSTHGPSGGVGLGNHDPISLRGEGIAKLSFEINQTGSPTDGIGIDDLAFYSAPRLFAATTSTNALISWPSSATNFVLEASPNLSSLLPWELVTNRVDVGNSQFSVQVSLDQLSRFFRLRRMQP